MESHALSPSACLLGCLVFFLMPLDVSSFSTPHLGLVVPAPMCHHGSLHSFFLVLLYILGSSMDHWLPHPCVLSVTGSFMLQRAFIHLFLCSLILYSLAHAFARCLSPLSVCLELGGSLLCSLLCESVCCDYKPASWHALGFSVT